MGTSERARSIVLDCCLHDNEKKFDLRVAVVMPDHVHLIFTPLTNTQKMEVTSLAEIMDAAGRTFSDRSRARCERNQRSSEQQMKQCVRESASRVRAACELHGMRLQTNEFRQLEFSEVRIPGRACVV